MKYLSLLLLAVLVALAAANPPEPEVDTKGGKLRGKWSKSDSGRPVASFEGVPYAKPPVGALRFSPPVPMEPWSDVRVADAPGSMCLQRNIFLGEEKLEGSEDCLYLNVYAPETLSREKPVPVMVFVHGGGFLCGSGSLYTHEYLTDRDVVLVTFNYRLGPLGFLSTADSVVPGNIGMKDMVLVLHWVQDNIRAFGGDPSKVTIFGESAGGASVHMLVLSPLSKGLFHRAIPMSGNALAPWAFQEAATSRTKTNKIAKSLGCPTESSEQLKQCLMGKSAEDIQGTDKLLMEWMVHPMVPFRPTAEPSGPGAFLDRHPKHMYEAGLAADVPFMTGFTTNEGCLGAVPIIENPSSLEDFDRNFNRIAPIVFMRSQLPTDVSKEIFDKIRKFYFDDKAIGKENKWQMIDVFTDCFFTHSCLETVKLQKKAAKSQLFMYQLAHTSNRSWAVPFGAKDASYGVCHADDLLYLFPLSFVSPGGRSTEDKAFSKHLVELFTTFAETGRPAADGSWQEVQNPERAEYMYLSEVGSCSMRQDYENKRMNMWYQLPVNVAQAEGPSTPAVLAETCPRGSSCQLDGL